ncbi:hypothetical protein [Corynebacterium sp.]|uniref:hypothetical protein n=1 Tax=Corynebacterium sp. TaxID=1720 RepID=UPI003B3B18CD
MAEKKPAVSRKQCGSTAGYRQHIKRGEKTCEECRAAHREHERARRAGEVRSRKPSAAKKRAEEEATGAAMVDGPLVDQDGDRPAFLKRQGRALWDEITGAYDLDAGARVILAEACRMRDRLERFSAALSVQEALWFELGEPEELRNGDVQVQVVVNNMIGEARQMQAAVATALGKIGVLKQAEAKSSGPSVEDQLAEQRRKRLAAAREAQQ